MAHPPADGAPDAPFAPRHGEVVQLGPALRRVTCANTGAMTGTGTNTYLVGRGTVAVIDPGPHDPDHADLIVRELAGEAVSGVLVTHLHKDHSSGAAALAHRLDAPRIAADPMLRRRDPAGSLGFDDAFTADVHIADEHEIGLGRARLRALFTPGHASDHLCFEIAREEGDTVLLSGDHVMAWTTTVVAPPYGHMGDFLASLRGLLARPELTFLPGHGGPVARAHAHMRALLKHRMAREARVADAVRDGASDVARITRRAYPELAPRMLPVAKYSTRAHLEHLMEQGVVSRDGASYRAV